MIPFFSSISISLIASVLTSSTAISILSELSCISSALVNIVPQSEPVESGEEEPEATIDDLIDPEVEEGEEEIPEEPIDLG